MGTGRAFERQQAFIIIMSMMTALIIVDDYAGYDDWVTKVLRILPTSTTRMRVMKNVFLKQNLGDDADINDEDEDRENKCRKHR